MRIIFLCLFMLVLSNSAYSNNTYTFLMNDRGCPTCRLGLVAGVANQLIRKDKNLDVRIVFQSLDTALTKTIVSAFNKEIKCFTGDEANKITKFYLSE